MPDKPQQETSPAQEDPIISSSLSGLYLITALALVGTLIWALYDEFYGLRPWKGYQARFQEQYSAFLAKTIRRQAQAEEDVRGAGEFSQIEQDLEAAQEAAAPRVTEINAEVNLVNRQLAAVTKEFQVARGEVTALIYELEVARTDRRKASLKKEVEEAKEGPFEVTLPGSNGQVKEVTYTYDEIVAEFKRLQGRRAELIAERAEALLEATELRRKRAAYLQENLRGLGVVQMRGLQETMRTFETKIRQIHVPDVALVDRCYSCHVGTDRNLVPPQLVLTAGDMGGEAAFSTHPTLELLEIHNTDVFGCTPCHNGNGRATSSVEKAHGQYRHWLWPLFPSENIEAGCHQCHSNDVVLELADTLNRGKELYQQKGCIGCHRFEGFDRASEELLAVNQLIRSVETEKQENRREAERSEQAADRATDDAEFERLNARALNLRVTNSNLDHQLEQLELDSRFLMREQKKVGPSLKEVRVKIRPEWIPAWLKDTHGFRPTTKMPAFRMEEEQLQAVSAFIWQSGVEGELRSHPRGNAARGKELFETRGCMGCHSVGEGDALEGGTFAANLSRVGEKDNYDYLVRWIHSPRERTRPYCPFEKRDLGPQDYARHGLPFVFGLENSRCPNDGHELRVQQMTVMPNLRLTLREARDIATYMMTLKRDDASYSPAPYLDDPELKAKGEALVRHFGCAGCHEISTFEEESPIGTELTREGSKPIERLDFALLTHEAEHDGWYNHKGFFDRKLADPAFFDQGKERAPLDKLKMPKPSLQPDEITALTTFLLGSVDPQLPERYFYQPSDQRQDIQEGWWIVKKYNCMGCHQVRIGQSSILMDLPRYQDPDWKEQLPPSLIGEGARVNPDWLIKFLANPAMSTQQVNRNGVRPYLEARMPTFHFSPGEIRKLVRFFAALSAQPQPYIAPKPDPLTPQEQLMARQLFTHPAAPCLKCHATGEAAHDRRATAPNFLLAAERLKPGWTERWMLDPAGMSPGTAMPSDLFRREGERWVFAGPTPGSFRGYDKDHARLLVRYMFQFTPAELRRLTGR